MIDASGLVRVIAAAKVLPATALVTRGRQRFTVHPVSEPVTRRVFKPVAVAS